MVDKAKILAGRKIIDAYRLTHSKLLHHVRGNRILPIDHSEIMDKTLSGLKALGFNSTEELFAANEQLCYQEVQRCYQVIGACDGCKGRERGCIQGCYAERPKIVQSETILEKQPRDFYDWQHFEGYAPPNCGARWEQVVEPEFDIYWGMPEGIAFEQYQGMKQKER